MPYPQLLKLIFLFVISLYLSSCSNVSCNTSGEQGPKHLRGSDIAKYTRTSFQAIEGWEKDDHYAALMTFLSSCERILFQKSQSPISNKTHIGGKVADWQKVCNIAKKIKSKKQAKLFFEYWFIPYSVSNNRGETLGTFTAYYEIEIEGSLKPSKKYPYPVYAKPPNLDKLRGKKIISRTAIRKGSLKNQGLEIAWVSSQARLFFMQIQGSGVIILPDGKEIKLGYSGTNGHKYTFIGPYLKTMGAKKVHSPTDIIEWLDDHPRYSDKIMEMNQAYLFFQKNLGPGPRGAQHVVLTPERTLAIDPRVMPFGTPVWLNTKLPKLGSSRQLKGKIPYRRLMVAQDCGSAIKGAVRADIFFGRGKRAERLAPYMREHGTYIILLPKPSRSR